MKAPIAIGLSLLALVAVAGVSSDRLGDAEETVASAKAPKTVKASGTGKTEVVPPCLLYTSDAADERSSVDLGGRRIIKKKNHIDTELYVITIKNIKQYILEAV